jgi:RNA-directed DNA polymerase
VQRWLKAPLQREDSSLVARDRGSPQGSAISPLLAKIFLHYAFDVWMARTFPTVLFERYADDTIVHCGTERQAGKVLVTIATRLAECGLELNESKTRIVLCKDDDRPGSQEHESFTFLGYTFRHGCAEAATDINVGFTPALSREAGTRIRHVIRGWRLHLRTTTTLTDLARTINAVTRGWINYYGRYYRSELCPVLARINDYLVRWGYAEVQAAARPTRPDDHLAPRRRAPGAEPVRPLAVGRAAVTAWMVGAG